MTLPHLDLADPVILSDLLFRHHFVTRKSLGQHFLISRPAVEAIVDACCLHEGLPILEIGPGIGTLSRALGEAGANVTAVELDERAIWVLEETVGKIPSIKHIQGDILTIDLDNLLAGSPRWTAVGNLPYYITTPVISRLLEMGPRFARMIFMVQREVADRLMATPGSPSCGSLSIYAQVYTEVTRVIDVPRADFLPPPKVDSAVVCLTIREQPAVPVALQPQFFALVRAAFNLRRKTLPNALAGGGILNGDRAAIAELLQKAEISPTRRGETLSIAEYMRLAELMG